MIKVAILSGWHVHTKDYAREIAKMSDCEITVIWDEDEKRGLSLANEFSVTYEKNLDSALYDYDIDGVIITSATNAHKELMIKAANAKKHIFSEKVMALTSNECGEIITAIKENNVFYTISFVHKAKPLFIKLKQLSERLGKLTYGRVRNCHNGSLAGWLPDHFYSREQCGGGAMMDLGAHSMYLLAWYMGIPKSMASVFTSVTGREVEDNAVTVMEFDNGAIGVAETGFVSTNSKFVVELGGVNGSLYATINDNTIECRINDHNETISNFDEIEHITPLRRWVISMIENQQSDFGFEDGLLLTKFMECAYNSYGSKTKCDYK